MNSKHWIVRWAAWQYTCIAWEAYCWVADIELPDWLQKK